MPKKNGSPGPSCDSHGSIPFRVAGGARKPVSVELIALGASHIGAAISGGFHRCGAVREPVSVDDKPSLRRRGSFVAGKRFAEARDRRAEMALEPSLTPNRDQVSVRGTCEQ